MLELVHRTPRRRQHHSRSRAGCHNCKKRHVRCDELQPTCTKCKTTNSVCQYPSPTLSLEEKRWCNMQAPGVSVWQVSGNCIDPFDALPIKMPFRSQELLRYFFESESFLNPGSRGPRLLPKPKDDCVVASIKEPMCLQSTLLMAAIHFSWRQGSLHGFEQSFLYHKQDLISLVNESLGRVASNYIPHDTLKLIAILSVTESCTGNYPAAEAHLKGLLALLELEESRDRSPDSSDSGDSDNEVLERLILVAYHFASAIKSQLSRRLTVDHDYARVWQTSFSGLQENLVALRLLPYYFIETAAIKTHLVDSRSVTNAVKGLTKAVDKQKNFHETHPVVVNPIFANENNICDSPNPATCTSCRSMSGTLFAFTEAHVSTTQPLDPITESDPRVLVSWRGLSAIMALYLNVILHLWDCGQPIDARIYSRILRNIMLSLQEMDLMCKRNPSGWDFYFWMLYVSAYALRLRLAEEHNTEYEGLQRCIHDHLRAQEGWRRMEWKDANSVLSRTAWPECIKDSHQTVSRAVWNEAIGIS